MSLNPADSHPAATAQLANLPQDDSALLILWSQVSPATPECPPPPNIPQADIYSPSPKVELNIAVICASAPAIRPLFTARSSDKKTYKYGASSASGALALRTFGGSELPVEPGSKNAAGGAAVASESGENIVIKSDGEAGSAGEMVSLDITMERIEVVGSGRSESSRDLEFGR